MPDNQSISTIVHVLTFACPTFCFITSHSVQSSPPGDTMVKCTGDKKYATPKTNWKIPCKEMTTAVKGMIITFFYCLRSIMQEVLPIGQPSSTVKSFLICAIECQSLDNLPQSGHPCVLSPQQYCTII